LRKERDFTQTNIMSAMSVVRIDNLSDAAAANGQKMRNN